MFKAEVGHPADDEGAQVNVRVPGWQHERRQDIHRAPGDRIRHQWQVAQRLDGAVANQLPHPAVFTLHVFLARLCRTVDIGTAQVVEAHLDGARALAAGQEQLQLKLGDVSQVRKAAGSIREVGKARLRHGQGAGQELTFGAVEIERESQLGSALPGVSPQEGSSGGKAAQRRGVGCCGLGAFASEQVQLGHLLALPGSVNQGGAAIELADDLEDAVRDCLWRRARGQSPADFKVCRRPRTLGDQPVGGLLDAVVLEAASILLAHHEPSVNRRPKRFLKESLVSAMNYRQQRGRGVVAKTGQQLQCIPRPLWKAPQFAEHEVRHIFGEPLGQNLLKVPGPARDPLIEGEQLLVRQGREELYGEERIASGLGLYETSQGSNARRRAAEGIGD